MSNVSPKAPLSDMTEPKGRVFNFKLGCLDNKAKNLHVVCTATSRVENLTLYSQHFFFILTYEFDQ
jgi:hypothetical protein